jgi:hypothetical protein
MNGEEKEGEEKRRPLYIEGYIGPRHKQALRRHQFAVGGGRDWVRIY